MGLRPFLRGDDILKNSTRVPVPAPGREPAAAAERVHVLPDRPAAALAIADVWAAVRVLADAASSLPLHVYRKTSDGRERVDGGELDDLLERPGPATTQADLISSLMSPPGDLGERLRREVPPGRGDRPGRPPAPDRVRPELQGGQLRFRYSPPDRRIAAAADRGRRRSRQGPYRRRPHRALGGRAGLPRPRPLRRAGQARALLLRLRGRGRHRPPRRHPADGRGRVVLRPGPDQGEDPGAEARPHGILVIQGDAEYLPVANKLDDSQFVEQRRLAAQEIARVFRIPSHMLGAPTGDWLTYATVEQEVDRLRPLLADALAAPDRAGDHERPRPDLPAAVRPVRGGRPAPRRRFDPLRGLRPSPRSGHRLDGPRRGPAA